MEEGTKDRIKIVHSLVDESEMKNENLNQLQIKHNEKTLSLIRMLTERDDLLTSTYEETRKLQRVSRDHIKRILEELVMLNSELENKKKSLDSWSKELDERELSIECERQQIEEEKANNNSRNNALQLALEVQKKVEGNLLRLVEKHKREKQEALTKVLELERNLGEQQKLESENQELQGKLKILKQMGGDDDGAMKQKLNEMNDQLNEKEEDICNLQNENQQLLKKERESTDELQKARRALIENNLRNNLLQMDNCAHQLALEVQKGLVEKHKREKQEALKKVLELERNLGEQQKLELENQELTGKLKILKQMGGDDNGAMKQKFNEMNNQLNEKEDDICNLQYENQQLLKKERESTDELQKARKALIEGLTDMSSSSRVSIGIKRMGEIEDKAFKNACKKRYSTTEVELKAAELVSQWQEHVKNPIWHPFRVVEDDMGVAKNVLEEDDELLLELQNEWGVEAYKAVTTALKEMCEYNPSGCYVVPELWNFKENRKATLEEVISHTYSKLKTLKRKRTSHL